MQGFVTENKGAYVKAAIIKFTKISDMTDVQESGDEINGDENKECVTYAETDEEGRFVIRNLNPEDRYVIEIFVEPKEAAREIHESKEITEAELTEDNESEENPSDDNEPEENPEAELAAADVNNTVDSLSERSNRGYDD
jgi:hypothetical protein